MQGTRNNSIYQQEIQKCCEIFKGWSVVENKTILITGATGLIGVFLIDVIMDQNKRHNSNINIIALGRNEERAKERLGVYWNDIRFRFMIHDVNETFHTEDFKNNIDFIIHGASNTHPILYSKAPIDTIETNVIGTKNLLELAVAQDKCRFVFMSSVEIYGENMSDKEAFQEEDCGYLNCNTLRACYSEGKRLGETLCQAYMATYNIDVVIPRLCRVYGPTMLATDSKVFSQFMLNTVAGDDIILKSEGKQKYSYIYVFDAVTAILTIMTNGKKGEAYNISDINSDITLKELAEYMASINKTKVIYQPPNDKERRGYSIATKAILNSDKLINLGWRCQYKIHEGIRVTYNIMTNKKR